MDVNRYLERINYSGSVQPSLENLTALSNAHLMSIPFENYDIHLGLPIRLNLDSMFRKLISRKRGGYCLEINGLYAELLKELGYSVKLVEARVYRQGKSGEEFDHLALCIALEGKNYLVDVGFGDASVLPIELEAGATRSERNHQYRIHHSSRGFLFEVQNKRGGVKGYEVTMKSQRLNNFAKANQFHQNSVNSWFTQALICVIATSEGTQSLIDGVWNDGSERIGNRVNDGLSLQILRSHFGLNLPRMPEKK